MVFNESSTRYDELKTNLISLFTKLLAGFEDDIESGIAEGIYVAEENVHNRLQIKEAKEIIKEFQQYCPVIYMYVDGGQIQGMSATENIAILKFDQQDYDASTEPYMDGLTPASWQELINEKTNNRQVKSIY